MCDCDDSQPMDEFPDTMRISSPQFSVEVIQDDEGWVAMADGVFGLYSVGESPEEALCDLLGEIDRVVWN